MWIKQCFIFRENGYSSNLSLYYDKSMRLLCRIFLIFCMLFISLSAQACSISLFEENKTIIGTVISTDKQKSEDIINSKHNESVLQLSQKNEGFSIGIRKTGSNFDINPNQLMNIIPSQFSCL